MDRCGRDLLHRAVVLGQGLDRNPDCKCVSRGVRWLVWVHHECLPYACLCRQYASAIFRTPASMCFSELSDMGVPGLIAGTTDRFAILDSASAEPMLIALDTSLCMGCNACFLLPIRHPHQR